jgi:serine/threonine-protein kinase
MAERPATGWVGALLSDKWRIEARIARGGVATVYRATHRHGQKAAIKIMHPELARNEDVRRRFLREGYVANKVGHPGVVEVLDDDVTDGGSAYIVMELLEGGELLEDRRERLGGKLGVAESVDVMMQVLDVLAAAHENGIIHRDIKPDNIYVRADGSVKLLDFGIAHLREAAREAEPTMTGHLLGTPDYMAPEQALGTRGQIDARTDVYAVGATLFTLLSGEAVHPSETLAALIMAASSQQARSLATTETEVPREIVEVVDKALSMEKARRWPNARAMQDALLAAKAKARLDVPRSKSVLPAVAPPPKLARPLTPPVVEEEEEEAPSSGATLVNAPPPTSGPTTDRNPDPPSSLGTLPFTRPPADATSITEIRVTPPISSSPDTNRDDEEPTQDLEDAVSEADTVAALTPPVLPPRASADSESTRVVPLAQPQTPQSVFPTPPPFSPQPMQQQPFMPWPPQQPMQQAPNAPPPIAIVAMGIGAVLLFALFLGMFMMVCSR